MAARFIKLVGEKVGRLAEVMSRQKTDLRPSVVKMTIKNPLPNISPSASGKERTARDAAKLQPTPDISPSKISKMIVKKSRQNEKMDNTEQLMKEIEVCKRHWIC